MKTSTKFKAGCGILAVFIAGFVLGVISLIVLIAGLIPLTEGWKSDKSKEFIASQMIKKLQLTPEQEAKFRPLVYEELDRRWEFRREFLLKSRKAMEERYLEQAAEFLTEEQLETLQGILANWRKEKRFMLDSWDEDEDSEAIVEGDDPDAASPESENRVQDESAPEE